jgi:hypothetical protein
MVLELTSAHESCHEHVGSNDVAEAVLRLTGAVVESLHAIRLHPFIDAASVSGSCLPVCNTYRSRARAGIGARAGYFSLPNCRQPLLQQPVRDHGGAAGQWAQLQLCWGTLLQQGAPALQAALKSTRVNKRQLLHVASGPAGLAQLCD